MLLVTSWIEVLQTSSLKAACDLTVANTLMTAIREGGRGASVQPPLCLSRCCSCRMLDCLALWKHTHKASGKGTVATAVLTPPAELYAAAANSPVRTAPE